ncbi:MAG TPA: hypothetical protein VHV51_05485 [Polyangiaceae bacterium]|nr:hypothetical protein [Polyangiaceae bacterium]
MRKRTAFSGDVAGSGALMGRARYLWLLLPIAGLVELGAFVHDARSAPRLDEWQAVRGEVAKLKGPGDLVVVAPEWTDPLAREAFGDALMPIANEARADDSPYARAIEVSELSASAPEFARWPTEETRDVGRFRLRVHRNPEPAKVLFSFLDHVRPQFLAVHEGATDERACQFTAHAAVTAGGLHGHLAFPRERFNCGGEEFFVGVTILDDQNYRPRRCIWAHPRGTSVLRLNFSEVTIGRQIHGYAGLSYFLFRDGLHGPTLLTARVNGEEVGRYLHHDELGWHGFDFDTSRFAGQIANVEFDVHSDDPSDRQFCFYADTR